MKKVISILSIAALAAAVFSCGQVSGDVKVNTTAGNQEELVKRGEYLVTIGGCHDCHSPKKMTEFGPVPDPDLLLSGHPAQMPVGPFDTVTTKSWVLFNMMNTAAAGPWGVSFSANLTSDATGIGNWTEDQFKRAITQGKYKGLAEGRPMLPPMPWPNLVNMKDEDIKAMFVYLKSTKPIRNVVPAPVSPADLGKYVVK
ncbi:MAG: diheme cytochrome c-553 [Chitinophagaceae bacterium]